MLQFTLIIINNLVLGKTLDFFRTILDKKVMKNKLFKKISCKKIVCYPAEKWYLAGLFFQFFGQLARFNWTFKNLQKCWNTFQMFDKYFFWTLFENFYCTWKFLKIKSNFCKLWLKKFSFFNIGTLLCAGLISYKAIL